MASMWPFFQVKVELEELDESMEAVARPVVADGLAHVKVEPEELDEPMEAVARPAVADGLAQVKVEGGERPEGSVDTCGDDAEVNAVVMKARRLAVPKEINHKQQRRMSRPGGREKYGVDRDSWNLSIYHRSKLRYLLRTLVQQRKWHHASGVLGVLLGLPAVPRRPTVLAGSWSDFAAAMDVFKRVDGVRSSDLRIRRMFRLLNLRQPNARARGKVQIELALYLMSVGERQSAYDELRPIVVGKLYREDPVANMCHGVNSYYLWYENAVDGVSKLEVTQNRYHMARQGSESLEGTGENDTSEAVDLNIESGWGKTHQGSLGDGFAFRDSQAYRAANQHGRDDMQLVESGAVDVEPDMNIWQASQKSIYEETDEQGFVQTGEEFWRSVIVPYSQGLDRRLFPIEVPRDLDQKHYLVPMTDSRTRDLHAAAVKHLKQALASAPDMLAALLPLVQLLLAVHDIKGAVDEIDKCSHALKRHFIPPSIKVALLESLDQKDPIQLAACHRDVLSRNPSSVSSLKGLVNLHASGNLETEVLLECICLHLDVDLGAADTWQKLASCLLEVEGRLGQLSIDVSDMKVAGESIEEHIGLSRDHLRRFWSCRYRWWLMKHFNTKVTGVERQPDGAPGLLAYKAACAAHIYGPGEHFVEQSCKALEKAQHHGWLNLVEHHCERSLKLFVEPS